MAEVGNYGLNCFCIKAKNRDRSLVQEEVVCTMGAWCKLKAYVKEYPTAPFPAIRTLQEITDEEINQMFKETLLQYDFLPKNLMDEQCDRHTMYKVELLELHIKGVNLMFSSHLEHLNDLFARMSSGHIPIRKLAYILHSLKVTMLVTKGLSCEEMNSNGGLNHLCIIIDKICHERSLFGIKGFLKGKKPVRAEDVEIQETILIECLLCFTAFFESQDTMDILLNSGKPIVSAVRCWNARYTASMTQALKFIADLCFAIPVCLVLTLEALEDSCNLKKTKRFKAIQDALQIEGNSDIVTAALRCINAIINSSQDETVRLQLREEFFRYPTFGSTLSKLYTYEDRDVNVMAQLYYFWNSHTLAGSEEFNLRKKLLEQVFT